MRTFLARGASAFVLGLWLQASGACQVAEQPIRLELQINGEQFTIETDELATLKSQKEPGVTYRLAARVAQYQPWRLNTIGLEYHRGFAVADDEVADIRTATFKHRLGFAMTISDLGGTLDAEGKQRALKLLTEATTESIKGLGGENVEVSKPATSKLGNVSALGVTIGHVQRDLAHRSLAYVLTGEDFAATAVIQFLEQDQPTVVPLVKHTLESIASLEPPR